MWTTIGHDWAVGLMSQALQQGRLAHTYLLAGPEHIGKTHLALEIAAALNCTAPDSPCHACDSCEKTSRGRHPDLILVEPEKDRIRIDQIRALPYELALSPVQGRWRICVLIGFHKATVEAANALLKTLEEPPSRAVILLTATDASLLLPTIVSRCQVINLRPVGPKVVEQALASRGVADREQARLLARLSAGRVGWALNAAHDPQVVKQRQGWIEELLRLLPASQAKRLQRAEELARSPALAEMLRTWESLWRDVMLSASGRPELCTNLDYQDSLLALATELGVREAARLARDITRTLRQLDQNVNARLALEVLLLGWRRVHPRAMTHIVGQ